jgi:outer membrane protein OmpA-like peptidoglycan-associated protein
MKGAHFRRLVPFLCCLVIVLLSGCAAQKSVSQKSVIILLPEDGKVSGEVTVENAQGSQVLNRSWQSVEIAGSQGLPGGTIVLDETTVQGVFGGVMSAMPLQPAHFLLYYKQGGTELRPESQLLLPAIVKAIAERHPAQLIVVGHTDTMGTDAFNYQLGLRRATSLAELLVSLGAAPAGIETSSRGTADLLVKTPDQTPEPRNRRVEVTIR